MTQPDEFAHRLTQHLEHGLTRVNATTEQRLAAMRRQALTNHPEWATHGTRVGSSWSLSWSFGQAFKHRRVRLAGAAMIVLLLVANWWITQPSTSPSPLPYSAEMDILLLTGELPPNIYADNTFSQWLEAHATF